MMRENSPSRLRSIARDKRKKGTSLARNAS